MRIRLATASDAGAVRAIYAPAIDGSAISFEVTVPSEEEMASRIVDRQPAYPWLVAEGAGKVLGYAYGGRYAPRAAYEWSVETSVYLAQDRLRRGGGRMLYAELLARLRRRGFRRAYAGITQPNEASNALHASFGFQPAGHYRRVGWKLGAWHDVLWWQLDLLDPGDEVDPPPEIVSR